MARTQMWPGSSIGLEALFVRRNEALKLPGAVVKAAAVAEAVTERMASPGKMLRSSVPWNSPVTYRVEPLR